MRFFYTRVVLLWVALTVCFTSFSQNISAVDAKKLLENQASSLGLSATDIAALEITSAYKIPESNTTMVYAQQTYLGIPVYNSLKVLAFANGKLVSNNGTLVAKIANKVNNASGTPSVAAETAVRVAATNTSVVVGALTAQAQSTNKKINYGISSGVTEPIIAELLWVPQPTGEVSLAWQVQLVPAVGSAHWMVRVNAINGEIIAKDNFTLTCTWQKIPHLHDAGCLHVETTVPDISHKAPKSNIARGLQSFNTTVGNATYLVSPYPAESPEHAGGTPVVVTNPWSLAPANSNATTHKWHYDGTTDYSITRGNNVWAQEDRDGVNTTFGNAALSTTPLPNLTFNFAPVFNQSPLTPTNQNFMITNLFYWNNILHDISYLYGFNEAAGNFQQDNMGRGGVGNDYVIADAQDASGTNNANFATPVDGNRPRMQMFLWSPPASTNLFINTPESLVGFMTAPQSAFSTNNRLQDLAPVTADIVIYRDDFNNNSSGCVAAVNASALTGKIALIDRAGTCQFAVKARNAQNAGAVGVIVVSDANSAIGTMGGTADNTVTIPAVMISFADGQRIRTELNNGGTVNATLQGIQRDGDVDNGIIAHEFAHGISTRFTGGPGNSSCLNNAEQMGEGWSDYYTLLSTTNWATATLNDGPRVRGIGTYAIGQNPVTGGGIRPFPYSTSMSVNPQTYGTVASYGLVNGQTPVHAVGSVWCTMLWEMTWEIIALDGINPNLYNVNAPGGNSIALRLVNEGMRLQPCNPGFVDGRNAILQADTLLYGGRYSCAIWKAFAKRGLGVGASQGASTSYTDGVQDFRTPASASITKLSNKEHASQGEEITYTLRATCQCSPVSNLRIVDTLPANVTFVSSVGGTYNASTRTISYSNISLAAAASQNFSYTVRVDNGTFTAPTEHINDNVPANALSAPWFSFSLAGTVFEASSTRFRSAGFSYFAQNMATAQERVIFSTAGYPLTRVSTLSFWHYFNTESGYDGGVVELDVDGSGNWVDAGPYMITNGYNSRINADATGNPLAGRAAFTGSSNGQFINTVLNLASLAGRTVSVRFRFNSDNGVAGEGWYIDDINLTSRSGIFNSVDLYDNANSIISASNNITNINAFTLPVVWGSFTAEKVGANAILTWQTLQEQNTKHFVLERSLDGTQFASIFTTQARGNSTQVQTYKYTDVSPVKGINYYRIKQLDNDGRFTYSEVRTVRFDGQKGAISVIPNPIKSTFAVQIVGNQSLATIELLSMSGQKLAAYQQISELAKHEVPAGTKPGTYLLRIVDATSSTTQKIIIQ